MSTEEPIDGLLSYDRGQSSVRMTIDEAVYPLQSLYAAAFVFIDRCFVFIEKPAPTRFAVVLSARGEVDDPEALRQLIGEFANELLTCAWRAKITESNRALIESVTTQAIGGAAGPPSLDELAEFDFTGDDFDDPLGIAQSWERRYGKPSAEPQPAAAEPAAAESAEPAPTEEEPQ